jgi:hypothetical protein
MSAIPSFLGALRRRPKATPFHFLFGHLPPLAGRLLAEGAQMRIFGLLAHLPRFGEERHSWLKGPKGTSFSFCELTCPLWIGEALLAAIRPICVFMWSLPPSTATSRVIFFAIRHLSPSRGLLRRRPRHRHRHCCCFCYWYRHHHRQPRRHHRRQLLPLLLLPPPPPPPLPLTQLLLPPLPPQQPPRMPSLGAASRSSVPTNDLTRRSPRKRGFLRNRFQAGRHERGVCCRS